MLPYEHPPRTASEAETLRGFLDSHRAMILWKLEGLTTEQATARTVPSATTLLGVVKHLAWVERWWFCDFIGGQSFDYPWSDEDPDADWRIEAGETVESISQFYADCVAAANEVIDAAESLDVTGTLQSGERSLRWVLTHMIDETARHLGQMDIIRELIDTTTGYLPDD
ncbi:MAG: DinB family protein [Acidimicrobiia bacterium]|nr:DinB family protein [Acidimicrobiia bacterium]